MAAIAQGQYQDTDSPDSRMFNSNNRVQSNESDQGTGYSSSQLGLYGPYYNRTLSNQNNLNNSYNAYELRAARNRGLARVTGLPNRGLPLNSLRLAAELSPRKTRRAPSAESLGLTMSEKDEKLVVSQVRDDSPLARAGFKVGDQIETVNGKVVHSAEEFQQALGVLTVGQEIPIVIVRDEQSNTLKWTPEADDLTPLGKEQMGDEAPLGTEPGQVDFIAAAQLTRGQRGQAFLGVRVDPGVPNQVIVQAVQAGSPAQKAGLQPGDRIYSVSGVNLQAPQDLGQLLARDAPGSAVYLYVGRTLAPATGSDPRERPTAVPTPPENLPQPAEAPNPAR
ncbi:MAG TPA: PDZ domain-containing protein [Pirellulales bacterium]|jgi:S1-C subfamily serine protease|nr:PDZ domain-containing protein [Pirellulales bacterium]